MNGPFPLPARPNAAPQPGATAVRGRHRAGLVVLLVAAAAASLLVLVSTLGGDIVVTDLPAQDEGASTGAARGSGGATAEDQPRAQGEGLVFIEQLEGQDETEAGAAWIDDAHRPPFVVSALRVLRELGEPGQTEASDGLIGPPRLAVIVDQRTAAKNPLSPAAAVDAEGGVANGGRDGDVASAASSGPLLVARFEPHPWLRPAEPSPLVPEPRWKRSPPASVLGELSPIIPEIAPDRTPLRGWRAGFDRSTYAESVAMGDSGAGAVAHEGPPTSALARLHEQGETLRAAHDPNTPEITPPHRHAPMVLVRLQPEAGAAAGPTAPPAAQAPAQSPAAGFELDARPIHAVGTDTRVSQGDRPADIAEARLAQMARQVTFTALAQRDWIDTLYDWEAPGLCHNPLYFEEVNLERYGYRWPCAGVLQPVVSCGQFFATIPALPYKLVAESPCECVYTLGHYRPGSAVPYQVHFPRWRPGAGAAEAGVIAGLIFAIP